MKSLLLAILAACPALTWAQPSDFRLDLDYRNDRSVDRVLAKSDARDDIWLGERDYQAIDSELKEVSRSLIDAQDSFEPLKSVTSDFAGLALAEFKIVSTSRDGGNRELVRTSVRVELGGAGTHRELVSKLGTVDMTWSDASGDWRVVDTGLGTFRDIRAAGTGFVEITDDAFGAIDSFNRQLAVGVDLWRDRLDAAVGVSVYGHQGISLGDFDSDGLEDLYVSQPSGLPNRLYRNSGDGTFADATRQAGLDVLDDTSMSVFADVENDGDLDLILIGATPVLYRNAGRGRYERVSDSGLEVPSGKSAMFTGAAMADYDLDGYLDLFVCAYDFWQAGTDYDAPTPYYDAVNGPPNLLFRNDGRGGFREVAATAGLGPSNDRFSFAAAWGDYDGDGDPDLYVANDFGRNNLYRNDGDGTFSDVSAELGVEDLGAGMSAAWGDYDNDGDLDIYTANMWSSAGLRITSSDQFAEVAPGSGTRDLFRRQAQGNSLFRNDGPQGFTDVSETAGVRTGRWAWASDFVDLDSDGHLDLFVQNGYITGERTDDL